MRGCQENAEYFRLLRVKAGDAQLTIELLPAEVAVEVLAVSDP